MEDKTTIRVILHDNDPNEESISFEADKDALCEIPHFKMIFGTNFREARTREVVMREWNVAVWHKIIIDFIERRPRYEFEGYDLCCAIICKEYLGLKHRKDLKLIRDLELPNDRLYIFSPLNSMLKNHPAHFEITRAFVYAFINNYPSDTDLDAIDKKLARKIIRELRSPRLFIGGCLHKEIEFFLPDLSKSRPINIPDEYNCCAAHRISHSKYLVMYTNYPTVIFDASTESYDSIAVYTNKTAWLNNRGNYLKNDWLMALLSDGIVDRTSPERESLRRQIFPEMKDDDEKIEHINETVNSGCTIHTMYISLDHKFIIAAPNNGEGDFYIWDDELKLIESYNAFFDWILISNDHKSAIGINFNAIGIWDVLDPGIIIFKLDLSEYSTSEITLVDLSDDKKHVTVAAGNSVFVFEVETNVLIGKTECVNPVSLHFVADNKSIITITKNDVITVYDLNCMPLDSTEKYNCHFPGFIFSYQRPPNDALIKALETL